MISSASKASVQPAQEVFVKAPLTLISYSFSGLNVFMTCYFHLSITIK
jgi:hypothetical protein